MSKGMSTTAAHQIAASVVAGLAWAGFALHLRETMIFADLDPVSALWRLAMYFTETTNIAVAIVFTAAVLNSRAAWARSLIPGLAVAASLVGTVYWLILYPAHPPRPEGVLSNILIHAVTPLAVIVTCIAFPDNCHLDFWAPTRWLIYPALYSAYVLARGAATGQYPYAFNDPMIVGPVRYVAITVVLGALLFAWGHLVRWMINARVSAVGGLRRSAQQL